MSATSATILAAVSAPTPTRASSAGARSVTRAVISRSSARSCDGELADVGGDLAGDPGDHPVQARQAGGDGVDVAVAGQRPGRRVPGRVELMEVPAEPVDAPGPLVDQVFSVIDQQAQLPGGAVELGGGQVGVAQRGAGHGQRVDRVGLAVGARRVPGVGHQLRRHPHDPLTGRQQIGLEAPGQVPAVLHRPAPLVATRAAPPSAAARGDQRSSSRSSLVASCRPTSSTATTVWVRLCASIPRVIMVQSPFTSSGRDGTGRWAHLSGGDATLLSSHAGRSSRVRGRAESMMATKGTDAYEPSPRTKTSLTLTATLEARVDSRSSPGGPPPGRARLRSAAAWTSTSSTAPTSCSGTTSPPNNKDPDRGATRRGGGVAASARSSDGATHVGVATDHVIESFRNDLWPGYKDVGRDARELLAQFPLVEEALRGGRVRGVADGRATRPTTRMAAGRRGGRRRRPGRAGRHLHARQGPRPVRRRQGRAVGPPPGQVVRRRRREERLGVPPESVPDLLALVGDTRRRLPRPAGLGRQVGGRGARPLGPPRGHPRRPARPGTPACAARPSSTPRCASSSSWRLLFRRIATVETDAPVGATSTSWRWTGPADPDAFASLAERLGAPGLAGRARSLAAGGRAHPSDTGATPTGMARLSSKGQVTIPIELREQLGHPGCVGGGRRPNLFPGALDRPPA